MSSSNLLFLLVTFLGPSITLSSSNWIMCWVGLELNFLGAVPLLLSGDTSFMSLNKESVTKYFCVQSVGSALIMLGGVLFFMSYCSHPVLLFLFSMGLFLKLGIFPAHFWVPSVVSGLSWGPFFLVLTVQKVGPFGMMINVFDSCTMFFTHYLLVMSSLSTLVGSLIGLNQSNTRAMLGSSSISHTGWSCIGGACGGLWMYFFIYCLGFMILIISAVLKDSMSVSLMLLSLSGIPPFMMFIGKWFIIKMFFLGLYSGLLLMVPVLSTFLSIFFYLKFFYSYLMMSRRSSMYFSGVLLSSLMMSCMSGVLYILVF